MSRCIYEATELPKKNNSLALSLKEFYSFHLLNVLSGVSRGQYVINGFTNAHEYAACFVQDDAVEMTRRVKKRLDQETFKNFNHTRIGMLEERPML